MVSATGKTGGVDVGKRFFFNQKQARRLRYRMRARRPRYGVWEKQRKETPSTAGCVAIRKTGIFRFTECHILNVGEAFWDV